MNKFFFILVIAPIFLFGQTLVIENELNISNDFRLIHEDTQYEKKCTHKIQRDKLYKNHPGQGYQLKVNVADILQYLSNDESY